MAVRSVLQIGPLQESLRVFKEEVRQKKEACDKLFAHLEQQIEKETHTNEKEISKIAAFHLKAKQGCLKAEKMILEIEAVMQQVLLFKQQEKHLLADLKQEENLTKDLHQRKQHAFSKKEQLRQEEEDLQRITKLIALYQSKLEARKNSREKLTREIETIRSAFLNI